MPAPARHAGTADLAVYRRFIPLLKPHWVRQTLALAASACTPLLFAARIWLLKILIDTVFGAHQPRLLPVVAGGFIAVAVLRSLITYLDVKVSGAVGIQVVRDLRVQMYTNLQAYSLRYFHSQRLGDLLTRLSSDIAAIETLLVSGLSTLVANVVTIVLFTGLLLVLSPQLVLVAAAVLPVLAVTTIIVARLGRRAQRHIRAATSDVTSTAEEGLSAIALVKSFARSGYEITRFGAAADRTALAQLRAVGIRSMYPSLAELAGAVGTAVVVWVGASQVLASQLSLGSLVVFISYLASLLAPIQGLSRLAGTTQRALVGVERVIQVLDAPDELRERHDDPPLPAVRGEVAFSRVTFGYAPHRPVLHEVDLQVHQGEMVAVIGASGAGKTTLVSLLLSYYDPDRGAVHLDGHPLRQFDPDSARRQVAAVLQEPMLFDASVAENIRYGRLEATDAEVRSAANAACAHGFINEMPEGYDTVVGPRGARLSGGQRQRLAIARAVLKAAPVLVLDEATSALDPTTEALVLPQIRAACPRAAILLVAHRYSTVRHADRVIVLDRGRITESGTQPELLTRRGAYWEFAHEQAGSAIAQLA